MAGRWITSFCVLAFVLGAGCARRPNAALEHARAMYTDAAQTPYVTSNAPMAIHEAHEQLLQAEDAYDKGKSDEEVAHRAYLAEKQVEIARQEAARRSAETELAQLHEQRGRTVLEARTGEATARAQRLERELQALKAKETERGLVLTMNDVLFETGKAELKPGAMHDLYRLANFLKENPERQLLIEGYTDSTGSQAYNLQLSQARAEAVRNFLLRNGVSPDRVIASGYGPSYPVASNGTEAGRQQNRRVEIVVLNPGESPTAGMRPRSEAGSGTYER